MTEVTTNEAKAPKEKRDGVGKAIREAIFAGKSNADALAYALEKFPEAGTKVTTISWYRNKLRQEGYDVPTARDLKAASKAAEASAVDPLEG